MREKKKRGYARRLRREIARLTEVNTLLQNDLTTSKKCERHLRMLCNQMSGSKSRYEEIMIVGANESHKDIKHRLRQDLLKHIAELDDSDLENMIAVETDYNFVGQGSRFWVSLEFLKVDN